MVNQEAKARYESEIAEREHFIQGLVEDYEEYLEDFDVEDLRRITNSGVFTLNEANKAYADRDRGI